MMNLYNSYVTFVASLKLPRIDDGPREFGRDRERDGQEERRKGRERTERRIDRHGINLLCNVGVSWSAISS